MAKATGRYAGIIHRQRCRTRGESYVYHVYHMPPQSSNKATYSGFETQRRRHQKSKTGVGVVPQMDFCSANINKKFNLNLSRKILEYYPYPEQELIFRSIYIDLCWRVSYMKLILKSL